MSEFWIHSGFPAFRSGLSLLNSVWRTEWPFSSPALGGVGRGSARSVGPTFCFLVSWISGSLLLFTALGFVVSPVSWCPVLSV